MPPVIANTVADLACAAAGVLILAAVACAWASLVWWSPLDPSLSLATSAAARNLLGHAGAILSDLLVESFGLSSLVILLPPMFWGLALVQRDRVPRLARCILAWLLAIAATATALASLPAPEIWPAHHGLGGIAGEALSRFAAIAFSPTQARIAGPATGLVMVLLALVCLRNAVGLSRPDRATRPTQRHSIWRGRVRPSSAANERTIPLNARDRIEPAVNSPLPDTRALPRNGSFQDPLPTRPIRPAPAPTARVVQQFGPYAAFETDPDPVEDEFDTWTEAASRGIAARFAPAANAAHALQEQVSQAFGGPNLDAFDPAGTYPEEGFEILPPSAQPRSVATQLATQPYKHPSLNLLERPRTKRSGPSFAASLLRGNARLLEDVMAEFGVVGQVHNILPGPVVTLYEFEPARGTRTERVIALADDIARGMGAPSARIAAVPGRAVLSVELPNEERETICLRDIFDAEAYRSTMDLLPIALGRTATGDAVVGDLTRMPHLLVAGSPGSGKSVGINAMILSLVYKHGPDNCRFLMIDQRMVELSRFEGIPHLLTPVVTDPHKAVTALAWCVREMEERMKRMAALGVRSIDVFNNRVRNAKKRGERLGRTVQTGFDELTGSARFEHEEMSLEPMPYIVIVIEEFAGLMAVVGRELEGAVQRLAEAARATGIHLIMACERPAADVMTAPVKAGLPVRMGYKMNSRADSRAVFGVEGAEQLLGAGDMLYATGVGQPMRVHGAYVSNEEVESVADSLRQQGAPRYIDALSSNPAAPSLALDRDPGDQRASQHDGGFAAVSEDALFDRAVAVAVREQRASIALLQRRLNISPSWAAILLSRLQSAGVIAPAGPNGVHPVLTDEAA